MRTSTNGSFRRQESSKSRIDPKTNYFLAFEGVRTEYQYFSGIHDKQESLGITALRGITLLQRHATKESKSNPAIFLPQVIQSLEEYRTGNYHVCTIVDHAVDWLILHNHLPKKGCKKQNMLKSLLKRLEEDKYSPDEVVHDLAVFEPILYKHLNELYTNQISVDALEEFHTYLKQQFRIYTPGYDKAGVIIDRDPDSFTSSQYEQVLELCRGNNVSLYLSNPCFEFWLLLHFPVVLELDRRELLENKKISRTKSFLEGELQKIDSSFQKNHLRFEMFEKHIDTAIKNEAKFCEDIAALKTELGSNVGKLLSELKSASEIHPFLSATLSRIVVAKGDNIYIRGTAIGKPNNLMLYIFGLNYYKKYSVSVETDGNYEKKIEIPSSIASNQYFVVVQHPMDNGQFDVYEENGVFNIRNTCGSQQGSFAVTGANKLQGHQAANALTKMIDNSNIDDIYTKLSFTVVET